MDFETMRNLPEGWSLPIVAKTLKPTSKFHYFIDAQSACEKWQRPEFAHPSPPDLRDACLKCYGAWAKQHGTPGQLDEWRERASKQQVRAAK